MLFRSPSKPGIPAPPPWAGPPISLSNQPRPFPGSFATASTPLENVESPASGFAAYSSKIPTVARLLRDVDGVVAASDTHDAPPAQAQRHLFGVRRLMFNVTYAIIGILCIHIYQTHRSVFTDHTSTFLLSPPIIYIP